MSSCELKESLEVVLNFAQEEKHTVLIVDDEQNNLQLLKRTFRGKYNLLTASNGIEALDIVRKDGIDSAAVVYDAIKKAQNENYDILLIDTAGRLQNKRNLMEELNKVKAVIDKLAPNCLKESMLVLDANTGQNGLSQAKLFSEAVNLTSVALTKLDGSAKGGIIIAIAKEFQLPVKLIGVGEKIDDLKLFNPNDFLNALFEKK